ncbi:ATP-binding protein [Paenibacillus sp. GCM10023248]|uniref:ATP-binding protein n=1 Tax=unclassified Paenibacillus TaxID=185978 RepID=UPI002378A7F0|nr:ATP-binding protein [Paenibacillus sp. MAHUQ-63]MDD9269673.1 ATP-binding protein [Paenibacillus sp. MAHUQ-63]
MILFDFIVNIAIFSLLVSTPLVIRSFIHQTPIKYFSLWASLYAGVVSVILVILSIKQQGYSYDIRYAPVILVFAYFGPIPGVITGLFSLLTRLISGGNWAPAIIGWLINMTILCVVYKYMARSSQTRKTGSLFMAYVAGYLITILSFHILLNEPLFHLQYVLFVMLGVILGGLLIESNDRLLRINKQNKYMEATLEKSESNYKLIANHTSDLIMVMEQNHTVSYFSPSHELVLGFEHHELEGNLLYRLVHPKDLEIFNQTISKLLGGQEGYSLEIRLKHKDGHWKEFESRCQPVKGSSYVIVISRDISERKKAEEILLQSEKLSIVGELAAGIAHEIRNPLTTIKGFLQVYKEGNYSRKHNDLLLSELERIEAITSEFLSLAKPQLTQLTVTDLRDLVEYTTKILSPEALLKNIEIQLSYEATHFPITGEKNQLKQMFLNIIKNAMESMPEGGEIQICLRKDGENHGVISIKDHGCGIPEELLPKLGEPFYSLKEKGTGLGLMICKKIIKQHEGNITYSSKMNEGTLVEIRLPLLQA